MALLRRLEHKNILPLYGLVSDLYGTGTFGMVCPWIENGDLTCYLFRLPSLSFSSRLRIVGLFTSLTIPCNKKEIL
jgi:hypothetical protein